MKKLTQQQLAELADISTTFLGEIERGKKMPGLNVLIQIINALDISADWLLRDEVESSKTLVLNDITQKLDALTPNQRKCIADIIDAYIKNISKIYKKRRFSKEPSFSLSVILCITDIVCKSFVCIADTVCHISRAVCRTFNNVTDCRILTC